MMRIRIVTLPHENLSTQGQDEFSLVLISARHDRQLLAEITVIRQPMQVSLPLLLSRFAQEAERILQFSQRYDRLELRKRIEHVESFAGLESLLPDYRDAGSKCVSVDRFPKHQLVRRIIDA